MAVVEDGRHIHSNVVASQAEIHATFGGIVPEVALARTAGLEVDDGIVVDGLGRTSDPRIFAAGDATRHPVLPPPRRLRLESWQNAQNQAIAVARVMCGGSDAYAEVPWFWSDQYDLNLQMVGVAARWDRVVFRGNPMTAGLSPSRSTATRWSPPPQSTARATCATHAR
jgi:3-phenylpropionate/trans-cinnamate dioxygenase ferredoxin reductase subunit